MRLAVGGQTSGESFRRSLSLAVGDRSAQSGNHPRTRSNRRVARGLATYLRGSDRRGGGPNILTCRPEARSLAGIFERATSKGVGGIISPTRLHSTAVTANRPSMKCDG